MTVIFFGCILLMVSKKQFKDIDQYINTFPEEIQSILNKIKYTIKIAAPDALESISYQMPVFKLKGKNLVYFAGWKNHIGFYPMPSAIDKFKKELSKYKWAKGSIQFPLDRPIPYELINKIVLFRIKELENKKINRKIKWTNPR